MLEIKNVSKEYISKKAIVKAVNNVSLTIDKAEAIGFLGSNGAGKTTLVKMISNLISPTSGKILLNGENINENNSIAQKYIGTMLEGARNVYNFLSVEDNITYFCLLNHLDKACTKKKYDELLELFNLKDKRNEIVSRLSRGMQQKVAIMVSVLKEPEILILDEPTLGLDVSSQLKMRDLLQALSKYHNKTLIICSHDIALAENVCDKIAIFHEGNLKHFLHSGKLKYTNSMNCYRCVFRNKDDIIRLLSGKNIFYKLENDTIEFETENLESIVSGINAEDIFLIEQQGSNLETVLKELN